MHIMTKRGWMPIATPKLEKLTESEGYRGPLPSPEIEAFVSSLRQASSAWAEFHKGIL